METIIKRVFLFFIAVFFCVASIDHMHARPRGGRRGRGRIVRVRSRPSVHFGFGIGTSYRGAYYDPYYDDPWYRYRRPRGSLWWHRPYVRERVILVKDQDEDFADTGETIEEVAEDLKVKQYRSDGNLVVEVYLPTMESDLFRYKGDRYPALGALYGASSLYDTSIFRESPTETELTRGRKKILFRLEKASLFEKRQYQSFIKRAIKVLKKQDRFERGGRLSEEDVLALEGLHDHTVHVGYAGVARSASSAQGALKKIIASLSSGDKQVWALPEEPDMLDRWITFKVEKRGSVVYVVIVPYE